MGNLPQLGEWPGLESEDVADSVIYVLSTPPRVQVRNKKKTVANICIINNEFFRYMN